MTNPDPMTPPRRDALAAADAYWAPQVEYYQQVLALTARAALGGEEEK